MTPARILVVEDDRVVARDIQHQLTRIGHTVVGVTPLGEDAVRLAMESHPDLVLMDIRLDGDLDGVDAAQQIRDRCQVPVVFLTAYADDETLQRARVTEPFGYLLKPFEDAQLRTVIEMALYKHTAERKLRESERRYAVTLASIGDAVIATDDRARVTFLNPVAEALTGWPQAEATGRPLGEVFHIINEETRQPVEDPAAKVLRLGTVVGLANHTVLLARDGRAVPIDDCGAPIIDDRGSITGVVLVFRDTTLRRQAEEAAALRLANARVDLAVRGSNIGIWEIDMPDGDYRHGHRYHVNIWEQLGYERPDSRTDHETGMVLVHPDDRASLEAAMGRYLAGETAEFEVENRVHHKDGSYRWILTRGVAVRDAEGKPVRFVGSCVDITDRKRAEQALRESEERFRGTFENAAVGIALCDIEGHFLRVNQRFCGIVGSTHEELVGKNYKDITHPDDLLSDPERIDLLMRGDLPGYSREKRYIRKDGSLVWAALSASVLERDPAGRPVNTIVIIQDISERKRLEGELRQAKETAEAANRAKDEFLANVSHEIRTPMNAILGMTELTLDTPLTVDQRQCLKTVKAAADNLLGIINDLLDFSKIEAGKLELEPADFFLRAALGDTLRILAMRAHKNGLELVCHVQPGVPDALVGDAGRLRQVLLNLVGNAIKFTEEGEVVVRVEVDGDPATREVGVRFAVSDTGIGIPPDKQEKVFRAFEQEDTSTTRKYGGTGLGLTIAARLVALMSGTITVDSEPGRGSTFVFTARFGRQPHPAEPITARPPVPLYNLPVLIVDDNATNRHILEEWLRGWQMEPAAVGDGLAAMDTLWAAAALGRPYPLVLLDARLPDTDGLVLATKIRKRPELSATRIIMLTSGDIPCDLARLRELRIDAHLLKPVQQDELLDTIYEVMSRAKGDVPTAARPAPAQESAMAPVPTATSLHILVAEDSELSAQVLERLLIRQGHRVRLASNGREALALAEKGGFDLLFLDVHMPELDGFQVVQAVRERELTTAGRLPIIALTVRSRKEDRERCLAAGMDDFLTKPVRPADLWAAIDRVLKTRSPRQLPNLNLLDAPVLLTACGGDPTLLTEMGQSLQEGVPEHLAAVRDALRAQDAPRLREAAHKFCGLLSEFSTVAGDLAGNLEDLAADAQLDKAPPILEQLETIARELMRQADGLSIEALRRHAEAADDHDRTAGP